MKILIIGGTRFLGRHLVSSARARGHEVTLFNRGKSNPGLFPQVERVIGDRERDLALLSDQVWDAVIDTCGYFPRIVRLSAEALKGRVENYVYISSISVYADFKKIGMNESDPVGTIEDETMEEITETSYGPLKALCEKAVQDVYGINSLIIRPGLIIGPHDPTDRFTYWPVRVVRGGEILAPDRPDAPTQVIDARDLSDFIIELIQESVSGLFNATGPAHPLTMGAMLEACKQMSRSDATFRWAPLDFLKENNIQPWSDLPAWLPDAGDEAGFSRIDISKAINAGLMFRPLEYTVRDTLTWVESWPEGHEWKAGLTEEREKQLLQLLNK